jgi:hypothetical protein
MANAVEATVRAENAIAGRAWLRALETTARATGNPNIAIGNGLSEDVWPILLDRIGPLRIFEFYASTEGNVWLYNVEGKVESFGRVPRYFAHRDHIALARFDHDSQSPARGPDGFGFRCSDGEISEALARISEDPSAQFEGYSEPNERVTASPTRQKTRSFATCSRPGTHGCEPATCCVATHLDSTRLSSALAIPFAGKTKTSRPVAGVLRACQRFRNDTVPSPSSDGGPAAARGVAFARREDAYWPGENAGLRAAVAGREMSALLQACATPRPEAPAREAFLSGSRRERHRGWAGAPESPRTERPRSTDGQR